MVRGVLKAEGLLRLVSLVLTVLTACLVGLDSQTKQTVFSVERQATVKDVSALWVLTIVNSITAGYNVIHLCKCFVLARLDKDPSGFNTWASWVCLLLDQAAGIYHICSHMGRNTGITNRRGRSEELAGDESMQHLYKVLLPNSRWTPL